MTVTNMADDRTVLTRPGTFNSRFASTATVLLAIGLIGAVAIFMLYDLKGSVSFALRLRAKKVGALVLVGISLSQAAVLFHTTTRNRILTPSMMGFDSLYLVIQFGAAYFFGTFAFLRLDERIRFAGTVAIMLVAALILHRLVLAKRSRDVFLLVLTGFVFGTVFQSLTSLTTRLIDPNEFVTLQDQLFANFSSVNDELLVISAALLGAALLFSRSLIAELDVLALGPDIGTSLGVQPARLVNRCMMIIAVLVSVATALVGPVSFLGLITANLAYSFTRTFRHKYTMRVASLLGAFLLVVGQFILQEVFDSATRLSDPTQHHHYVRRWCVFPTAPIARGS